MQNIARLFDPLDRESGSGSSPSTDDWTDSESIFTNEWGSQAATTFNPKGTDGQGEYLPRNKQNKYEKLYKLQNGKGEPNRQSTIRQSHIENDLQTFMNVLDMPPIQRERVTEIIENLDLSSRNWGGRRYEVIILTVCSLVADEHLSQRKGQFEDRLYLSDSFQECMDTIGMTSSDHRQMRVKVREKSDYF